MDPVEEKLERSDLMSEDNNNDKDKEKDD